MLTDSIADSSSGARMQDPSTGRSYELCRPRDGRIDPADHLDRILRCHRALSIHLPFICYAVGLGKCSLAAAVYRAQAADCCVLRQDSGNGRWQSRRSECRLLDQPVSPRSIPRSDLKCQYASPLELFDTPGSIFRTLCDVKRIARQDLFDIQVTARGR